MFLGKRVMFLQEALNETGNIRSLCAEIQQPISALLLRQRKGMVQVWADFLPLFRAQCGHGFSNFQIWTNAAMKVDACFLPITLDGSFAHVLHRCDFCKCKAAEEPQVDDFCEGRFGLGQFFQRVADLRELTAIRRAFNFGAKRRDFELTAALLRTATSRVINDQTPHYASGIPDKSVSIRKGYSLSAGDFEVSLMQECGRAEAHRGAVPCQFVLGNSAQLAVKGAEQRIRSRR